MKQLFTLMILTFFSVINSATINKADWDKQIPVYPNSADSLYYTIEFDKDSFQTVKVCPAYGNGDTIPANSTSINKAWWHADTTEDPVIITVQVPSPLPRITLYVGNSGYTYPEFSSLTYRNANKKGFLPGDMTEYEVLHPDWWDTLQFDGADPFVPLIVHDTVTGKLGMEFRNGGQLTDTTHASFAVSSDTGRTWDTVYNIIDSLYVAETMFGYYKNDTFYIDIYLVNNLERLSDRLLARSKNWGEWDITVLDPDPFVGWSRIPIIGQIFSNGRFYTKMYTFGVPYKIIGFYSDDSGATWSPSDTLYNTHNLNEWSCIEVKDPISGEFEGDVFAVLRPEDSISYYDTAWSHDYGATWGTIGGNTNLSGIYTYDGDTLDTDRGVVSAIPPYLFRTSDNSKLILTTGSKKWWAMYTSSDEGRTWDLAEYPLGTWAAAKYYSTMFHYGGDKNLAYINSANSPVSAFFLADTRITVSPRPFWYVSSTSAYVAKTDSFYVDNSAGQGYVTSRQILQSELPVIATTTVAVDMIYFGGLTKYNMDGKRFEDSTFFGIQRRAAGPISYNEFRVKRLHEDVYIDTVGTREEWGGIETDHVFKWVITADSIVTYIDGVRWYKYTEDSHAAGMPEHSYAISFMPYSDKIVMKKTSVRPFPSALTKRVPAWCRCGGAE